MNVFLPTDLKMEEKKQKKPKQFLEKPEYPGGKKALNEFIKAHLQYPEDAVSKRIEGIVTVEYMVTDEGEIMNPTVTKGLCPSCNEEALRLVRLLKYGKAHNRGIRLKSNCKLHIHFKLAPQPLQSTTTISYTTTPAAKNEKKESGGKRRGYTMIIERK